MFGRTCAGCASSGAVPRRAKPQRLGEGLDAAVSEHDVRQTGHTAGEQALYAALRRWAAPSVRTFSADLWSEYMVEPDAS